jgi:hypothetical protein
MSNIGVILLTGAIGRVVSAAGDASLRVCSHRTTLGDGCCLPKSR